MYFLFKSLLVFLSLSFQNDAFSRIFNCYDFLQDILALVFLSVVWLNIICEKILDCSWVKWVFLSLMVLHKFQSIIGIWWKTFPFFLIEKLSHYSRHGKMGAVSFHECCRIELFDCFEIFRTFLMCLCYLIFVSLVFSWTLSKVQYIPLLCLKASSILEKMDYDLWHLMYYGSLSDIATWLLLLICLGFTFTVFSPLSCRLWSPW